jgi:uncharacterized membrane protein
MQNSTYKMPILLALIGIGFILRFLRLEVLPPWTDECATMVFSLGNTFRDIPLNQVIDSQQLLQPLIPVANSGIIAVAERLLSESTHPPVYFAISHLWMKLFPTFDGFASVFGARSLSAALGVLSIPGIYYLGYFAFSSQTIGLMAGAMMAISPLMVFLGREARHYTLAMLLVMASLAFLLRTVKLIQDNKTLPLWICFTWAGINTLGVATHFFFVLTLAAEAYILFRYIWHFQTNLLIQWRRLLVIAAGTLVGCLIWLPWLPIIYGSEPTTWVTSGNPLSSWLEPLGRSLLWLISILLLLPSAITIKIPIWIVIISSTVTLGFLAWVLPSLIYGFKSLLKNPSTSMATKILSEYIIISLVIFLLLTYILGLDLTLAPRFQFVYAPAIILLLGACVDGIRLSQKKYRNLKVKSILLMAIIGGLTTVWNVGYLQNIRPDILTQVIQEASQNPVLIATEHKHHGQTGRMMGLAWEKKYRVNDQKYQANNNPTTKDWHFLLAHEYNQNFISILLQNLSKLTKPLDLWLVDVNGSIDLESQHCFKDQNYSSRIGEYRYKLYRCVN